MPELPEVETIRRQLAEKLVGKTLNKSQVNGIRRRGKILMIDFGNGSTLAFHLKLTGQLLLNVKPSKYTRKVFNFEDGTKLLFNDMIKFGWWKMLKDTKGIENALGPESLSIDLALFKELLKARKRSRIKPLLMNQSFIAGIGNIYADEILFASNVHPTRFAGDLSDKEIEAVLNNTKRILKKAIAAGGSSVKHYLDAKGEKGGYKKYHKVYHKEKCPVCSTKITKQKIGGRTAHFCPKCQK